MSLIRSLATLIAVFALILALVPGPRAYAVGMGANMDTAVCTHHDPDDCGLSSMDGGKLGKHGVGSCDVFNCCLGAVCVFAGLLPTTAVTMPALLPAQRLPGVFASLTGRDVAPPLDPPRPFA
jgi:hypothetical protein